MIKTNTKGTTDVADGALVYGPYIQTIPMNPYTEANTVKEITNDPAAVADIDTDNGWLYNKTTGGLWINHADQYTE